MVDVKKNGEPTKVVSIQKFLAYVLRTGTAYMDQRMARPLCKI